jgi:hypothetical protein
MPTNTKTIFLFFTVCKDKDREKELSDWYDDIHIPDVEAIPGFTTCVRYRISDLTQTGDKATHGLPGDYLSVVESVDGPEIAIANLQKAIPDWVAAGRIGVGAGSLFEVLSSAIVVRENPPA